VATLYYVLYGVLYAALLFHHSKVPQIGRYSVRYAVFLVLLAAGFALPALVGRIVAKYGLRGLAFALVPAVMVAVVLYAGFAIHYYYSETHYFDPFLQLPAPTPAFTAKPPGTFRILMLGGSTTADSTLAPSDRYPQVLQDRLRRDYATSSIEVFNAGMDWYTAKHSLINYDTNLRDWHPDLAVVMHGINDLYRSFSDPDFAVGPYDRLWSHFYGPAINGAKPPTFERTLFSLSAALYPYWLSEFRASEHDVPLDRYVSLPDFKRNLLYLVHDLKGDGVEVTLLTEPSIYKDSMTAEEREVLWFGRTFCKEPSGFLRYIYPSPVSLGAAMSAYNAVTKEVGADEHVTVIDVAARLAKTLENFSDDVHYRATGAHRVGDVVATGIEDAGLLRMARP